MRAPRPFLRIKFERQRRGLTQQEIANRTRLPQTTLCAIENGRLNPSPEQLAALAEIFGVHPARLLIPMRGVQEDEIEADRG